MEADSAGVAEVKAETRSDRPLGAGRATRYVAVVDDDRSVGVALCRLLRAAGIEAKAFESAASFLDHIQDRLPDCVVLDVQMPGMNGLELQQRLKDVAAGLPVIMMTGRDEASIHAICMAMGASSYLKKPLNDDDLLDAVERAISGRSTHRI
ncbi:response regulator transcription factor [Dongia sp.]|uniref:response regulator transcription factor n=1 Tax=Dongia sp. TaxID=1977262 RepID=UPI0037505CE1